MNIDEVKKQIGRIRIDPKDLTSTVTCYPLMRNDLADRLESFLLDKLGSLRTPDCIHLNVLPLGNHEYSYEVYAQWIWENDDGDWDPDYDDPPDDLSVTAIVMARTDSSKIKLRIEDNNGNDYEYVFPLTDAELDNAARSVLDEVDY